MTISQEEKTALNLMLEHLIEKDFHNLEFEALLKSKSASVKKNIDREGFENVIRRLKTVGLKVATRPDVLDISFRKVCDARPSNMRISITGLSSIRKYCSHNNIKRMGDNVSITVKNLARQDNGALIIPVHISDYNLKFNLKYEDTKLKSVFDDTTGIITHWKNFYKSFRYKKRYSFTTPDKTLSIDLTIVRSSTYKDGRPLFTKTFLESNHSMKLKLNLLVIGILIIYLKWKIVITEKCG
jgi:hypothetical protein